MGTSGAYSGSGGKDGAKVRDAVAGHVSDISATGGGSNGNTYSPALDPNSIAPIINLIRPRGAGGGADGPGGGGGGRARGSGSTGTGSSTGGGPRRSAARSARSAGRAAAAAYAYRTGDAATLARLGLDYVKLAALGDDFEVLRRIVEMACSSSDSTIEDHEQRLVAADVAEKLLGEDGSHPLPPLEDIVRETVATIIAQTVLVETGDQLNQGTNADAAEADIRDAAYALAERATLSITGATEDEMAKAIEDGIESLRTILGGNS